MKATAALLSVTLVLAGCSNPVYMGGDYTRHDTSRSSTAETQKIWDHGEFVFFWGLVETDKFEAERDLQSRLADGQVLTDIEVHDGTGLPGLVLKFLTLGLVSRREVEIRGHIVTRTPASPPG